MTVYLVGAGPGDPGLLTRKGAALIAQADVLVFDRLISQEILDLAPPNALRVDVGKSPGHNTVSQEAITATLIEHGKTGATVVRVKGGDPFVFGRGGEEAIGLAAAGVPYEIVPGISSSIAGPASAGIPVTLRQQALGFTVVTGHEDPDGSTTVDWEAHARTGATLVVLMGVGRIANIAERLIAGGRAPSTPVAAIQWATTDRQSVTRTTLEQAGSAGLAAPSIIVIGEVAALDLRWDALRDAAGKPGA